MVKYDTRITSPVNGSIKLVRRDRTVILLKDSGTVSYNPRSGWDEGAAAAFHTDCADPYDGFTGMGMGNHQQQPAHARGGRATALGGNSVTFADSASSHRGHKLPPPSGGPGSLTVSHSQVMGALGATMLEASESMASFGANKHKSLASAGGSNSKASRTSRSNSPSKQKTPFGGGPSELSAASAASKSSTHSIIPLHAVHTKFTIDLVKFSCRVEDHEHNVFDVNMRDPLCPRVSLAGEVEGLKPVAVTDTPKEPRVFIVNRSADAQEVLSMQDVAELERLVSVCPDAYKAMSDASSQPADLGEAKQHSYFVRRRSALPGDAFAFGEVFQGRPWQARERPATLSMALLQLRGAAAAAAAATAVAPSSPSSPTHLSASGRERTGFFKDAADPEMSPLASPVLPAGPETGLDVSAEAGPLEQVVRPRTMLTVSLVERMPLSKDGYEQLNSDVDAWTQFRASRVKAMDRFAVADNRSAEEVQEEEAIKKRIKAAYKAAKAAAAKKKAQEKEASAGQAMADIAEEEDEDVDDSDEDEDEDPEEREIKAAFESFAEMVRRPIERPDDAHHGFDDDELLGGQVPFASLRPALIQLFNRNITHDVVTEAMLMAGFQAPKAASVGLEDFRHVYQNAYDLLYPSDDADNDSQLLSNASPGRSHGAGDDDDEDFDATERPLTAGGDGDLAKADAPAEDEALTRPRSPSYWESQSAKGKSVLPTPPPLDFRPLQWTSAPAAGADNAGAAYPAGSALQVARNKKA
jgi:hypothetical protein